MNARNIVFPLLVTTALFSGCYGAEVDEDFNPELVEDVGSLEQQLPKGSVGAVNGQGDYCADVGNVCVSGEGDCDRNSECTSGTVCASNNGLKFGFSGSTDVCVPSHCTNAVQDGGETGIDCGAGCGTCANNCVGTSGGADFCVSCLCGSGQGDCDSTKQCQTGLVCGKDNGPNFGLGRTYDVCVPAHCTNAVLDAGSGETGVDTGGPCSSGGPPPPVLNLFFSEYAEGSSNNHHLEIYNAGTATGTCSVLQYFSGSTTPTTIALSATIAPGGIFVLCRSGGSVASPPCNQTLVGVQFSGDDAIELVCNGVTQDIIGQIGFDPGSEWGTGLASTGNNTLRRKCSVTSGDTNGADAFVPSTQWDGFALDTYGDLGSRVCPL